jgi:hypothetical protein
LLVPATCVMVDKVPNSERPGNARRLSASWFKRASGWTPSALRSENSSASPSGDLARRIISHKVWDKQTAGAPFARRRSLRIATWPSVKVAGRHSNGPVFYGPRTAEPFRNFQRLIF